MCQSRTAKHERQQRYYGQGQCHNAKHVCDTTNQSKLIHFTHHFFITNTPGSQVKHPTANRFTTTEIYKN